MDAYSFNPFGRKESARLLKMEEQMRQLVVGQDEAVSAISRAIRRSRAGIKNPKRPIGSFCFLRANGLLEKHYWRVSYLNSCSVIRKP